MSCRSSASQQANTRFVDGAALDVHITQLTYEVLIRFQTRVKPFIRRLQLVIYTPLVVIAVQRAQRCHHERKDLPCA